MNTNVLTFHDNTNIVADEHQVAVKNSDKGVPSAESSRSVRGLGKGVSGKPYPCLCNVRGLSRIQIITKKERKFSCAEQAIVEWTIVGYLL